MAWAVGSAARLAAAIASGESGRPGRQPELLADQVQAAHQLGDPVLDLEPRVDLEEPGRPVRLEQELGRRGIGEAGRRAEPHGLLMQRDTGLAAEARGRRLLDELLVASLDRAVALTDGHDGPGRVTEQLDLDMPCRADLALEIDRPVAEPGKGLGGRGREGGWQVRHPLDPAHPPSPASGRGLDQQREADRLGLRHDRGHGVRRSTWTGSIVPGTVATPAERANRRARSLSPKASMTSGLGPMKVRPASTAARAKDDRSARKP